MAITCNNIAPVLVATMPSNCATFIKNETFPSPCGAGTASASCNINISGGLPPYNTSFSYTQTPSQIVGCTYNGAAYTGGPGTNPQFGFAFTANDLCNLTIYGILQVAYTVTDSSGQTVTGSAQYNVNISRYGRQAVSGGGGGCVSVDSNIFGYGKASSVEVGDTFLLSNPYENTDDFGNVTYSEPSYQPMVLITTLHGAELTCSYSAPIPTKEDGYVNAVDVLNYHVPVATHSTLENGEYSFIWDKVVTVDDVGMGWVQHISVDDNCFWASDDGELFILHHNKIARPDDGISNEQVM